MTERDRAAEFMAALVDLAKRDPEAMAKMHYDLRVELTSPPPPWENFGSHVGPEHENTLLESWGTGDDGMPMWERLVE